MASRLRCLHHVQQAPRDWPSERRRPQALDRTHSGTAAHAMKEESYMTNVSRPSEQECRNCGAPNLKGSSARESVAGWCVQCVAKLFSGDTPQTRSFRRHFGDTPGLGRIAQAAFFGKRYRRGLENSLRRWEAIKEQRLRAFEAFGHRIGLDSRQAERWTGRLERLCERYNRKERERLDTVPLDPDSPRRGRPHTSRFRDYEIAELIRRLEGRGLPVTTAGGESIAGVLAEALGLSESTIAKIWEKASNRPAKLSRERTVPCVRCGTPIPKFQARRNGPQCPACRCAGTVDYTTLRLRN